MKSQTKYPAARDWIMPLAPVYPHMRPCQSMVLRSSSAYMHHSARMLMRVLWNKETTCASQLALFPRWVGYCLGAYFIESHGDMTRWTKVYIRVAKRTSCMCWGSTVRWNLSAKGRTHSLSAGMGAMKKGSFMTMVPPRLSNSIFGMGVQTKVGKPRWEERRSLHAHKWQGGSYKSSEAKCHIRGLRKPRKRS